MRYQAKSEDGRVVGQGRTIKTAVDRARKRGGAYVVDDKTGVIQWREPQAAKPEAAPSPLPWRVFRSGSLKRESISIRVGNDYGTAIMRVRHENIEDAYRATRAVNSHAALIEFIRKLADDMDTLNFPDVAEAARDALRDAGEAV